MTRSKQWCTQVWSPTCLCAQSTPCVHRAQLQCARDLVHAPHDPTRTPRQVSRCFYRGVVFFNHPVSHSLSIVCTPRARVMQINFYPLLHKQCTHSSSTRLQFATAEGRLGCQGESVNSRTLGRLASSNLYKLATATSVSS